MVRHGLNVFGQIAKHLRCAKSSDFAIPAVFKSFPNNIRFEVMRLPVTFLYRTTCVAQSNKIGDSTKSNLTPRRISHSESNLK